MAEEENKTEELKPETPTTPPPVNPIPDDFPDVK